MFYVFSLGGVVAIFTIVSLNYWCGQCFATDALDLDLDRGDDDVIAPAKISKAKSRTSVSASSSPSPSSTSPSSSSRSSFFLRACFHCLHLITFLLSFLGAVIGCGAYFDTMDMAALATLPPQLQPFRPLPIRVINHFGRGAKVLGFFDALPGLTLDPATLIRTACDEALLNSEPPCTLYACPANATGEENTGTCAWRKYFNVLTESLIADSELTTLGHVVARGQVIVALTQRALLQAHWRDHGLPKNRVKNPIFVVGLPRTGTTLTQELLAQDPMLRAPRTWETITPLHYLENGARANATETIKYTEDLLEEYKKLVPGIDAWHPIRAERPEECILTLAKAFDSQLYSCTFNVSSYTSMIFGLNDHKDAFEWHHNTLRTLQTDRDEQWVLKTPYYLALLPDIRRQYPDAKILHCHRNPTESMASASSIHVKTYGIVSDHVDMVQVGKEQADLYRSILPKAITTRKQWSEENSVQNGSGFGVVDVSLRHFQKDPIKEIKRIYIELLGRELSEDAESRMRSWLKTNKREKYGNHKFDKSWFGIDIDGDAVFDDYVKMFNVPP
eukprot:m.190644 g.190644  ORF g.190644 m.190644 type:complete len:561 (+) comp32412_c0_seq1:218-1900(+)